MQVTCPTMNAPLNNNDLVYIELTVFALAVQIVATNEIQLDWLSFMSYSLMVSSL